MMLRYRFSGPKFISLLTKIPIQAYKLFWAPTNIPNKLPKYFPHITQLRPSQIVPIISHILPNLSLHKYFSYHYQNWATKLYCLYINSNLFILWAKHKKPNKTLLKARCYMAPLKPVATQYPKVRCYITLLQSPLLHNNILQNLKLFIKANIILATIYKKLKYYFGNYSQNPNTTLVTIYKSPILFWQLFTKMPKYYFGNYLQKPNTIWQLFTKSLISLWQHFIETPNRWANNYST